ncbi:MAG: hypothetical protein GXO62_01855 [Epsilonproteobacteria bacterium]|nr:hypothetical protein [Campylobacterota bacterium]
MGALLFLGCGVEVQHYQKADITDENSYMVIEAIKSTSPKVFEPVLNIRNCDDGEVRINGDEVVFDNCSKDGVLLNGSVKITKSNCDGCECKDVNITFLSNFNYQIGFEFYTVKSSSSAILNNLKYQECAVKHIEGIDRLNTIYDVREYRGDFEFVLDYSGGYYRWYYKNGNLFLSEDEYLQIDPSFDMSLTPVVYDGVFDEYINGYVRLIGKETVEVDLKTGEVKIEDEN